MRTADGTIVPALDGGNSALFADLYAFTMMQSYWQAGHNADATFSLFVRRLPKERNFLVACGLDDVLTYLENLRVSTEAIAYLASLNCFRDGFLSWLEDFRFSGDVDAVAEGTPLFANEPILEVTAPIAQAQLVEAFIVNQVHLQTLLASKAARIVAAAAGRTVVDFGARRIHGIDAANKAARAFWIAGVAGTSNVLAASQYAIPPIGTMAHSYIQSFRNEAEAFRTFVASHPETTLLVDTYDTLSGIGRVIRLARELSSAFKVKAVRLDSGDLAALAVAARRMLDDAGLRDVQIFASSSLDEYEISAIVAQNAPITGFGVGTRMGVSQDAPSLDMVFKLCSYAGEGRLKLSPGKSTLPGKKQVFRRYADGIAKEDTIARDNEMLKGEPLLRKVMRGG